MMYSVVDIAGINSLSRQILANAAGAIVGMVNAEVPAAEDKPLIGATMFGVTTPCVTKARELLEDAGYEVLVFHATGAGGRAMEDLIKGGFIVGVLDVTTTELADELVGGVLSAGPDRLEAAGDLGVPQGSIRATVLIETLPAAFEMEEILYELRDHSAGLNAGRWDYIFSAVKRFKSQPTFTLPDRVQVTMTTPFMRAYTELLVRTCHKRGAHAMGGMAAFIPSRRDPEINEIALTGVRADKERESTDGFDGTWVAHPDLVSVARDIFETNLNGARNQRERMREDVEVSAGELVSLDESGGTVSEAGLRANISVALQYINSWLNGVGAAGINNLMEDAATAEISRGQIWQWIRHEAELDDGRSVTSELYESLRDEELASLGGSGESRYGDAVEILDQLVLNDEFTEFLTLPAYEYLD